MRSSNIAAPLSSTMAMVTFHLFFCASALQAVIIFWTSVDVRAGLVRMAFPRTFG